MKLNRKHLRRMILNEIKRLNENDPDAGEYDSAGSDEYIQRSRRRAINKAKDIKEQIEGYISTLEIIDGHIEDQGGMTIEEFDELGVNIDPYIQGDYNALHRPGRNEAAYNFWNGQVRVNTHYNGYSLRKLIIDEDNSRLINLEKYKQERDRLDELIEHFNKALERSDRIPEYQGGESFVKFKISGPAFQSRF